MKKVTLVFIVVLVVLGVVGVFVLKNNNKTEGSVSSQKDTDVNKITVVKKDIPTSQVPTSFPLDIPMESGAKIVQNYNATTNTGLFQATRVFETSKSLDENLKIYSDFINKNGWKLISSLNQANIKALAAQKNKGNLQITLSENTQTKVKTVSITYSEQK